MKRLVCLVLSLLLLLPGTLAPAHAAQLEHIQAADKLYALGLVSGTGVDAAGKPIYELDRAPTRSEAITVLVKLLGKAEEASRGGWDMPFTDVPDWAKNFVGYAYANGLTSGTSATTFGGDDPVTAAQYITFVLKALGYSANGDFAWDSAWELSDRLAVTDGRYNAATATFLRGDVFLISEAALHAGVKDTDSTLAQKLMDAQVFGKGKFHQVYNLPMTELNAEQVFAQCSPAVFYVEVYDSSDRPFASGSGFFLNSSGLAVTNHHVLEGASRATITTSDTKQTYQVKGIYDYSVDNDWVVMQVDGTGFASLEVGEPSTAQGGATVYAIGSPLGLQNTISQGLVSNPARKLDGVTYIQTSAAISHGSSGGALINKYGQVVGITSAGIDNGQNLNLAMPMTALSGYRKGDLQPLSALTKPASVSYTLSASSVTVEEGGSALISLNFTNSGLRGSATHSLRVKDTSVADAVWNDMDDNTLPWDIRITGYKAGTTQLVIYNDKTEDTVTVPITVTAKAVSSQKNSYELLRRVINRNLNPSTESYRIQLDESVTLNLYDDDAQFNEVCAMLTYYGNGYRWAAFLYLTPDSDRCTVSCRVYDQYNEIVAKGTSSIDPAALDPDATDEMVIYVDYSGASSGRNEMGEMHLLMLQITVENIDKILKNASNGTCSIRDFGFSQY